MFDRYTERQNWLQRWCDWKLQQRDQLIVCYLIILIYLAGWHISSVGIAKLSLKNSHQSGEYIREAL